MGVPPAAPSNTAGLMRLLTVVGLVALALFSAFELRTNGFKLFPQSCQFLVREFLNVDHVILSEGDRADDLVQLQVNGPGIAVLRILDEEHHEERDDGGRGVDHELPRIGIMKVGANESPCQDK